MPSPTQELGHPGAHSSSALLAVRIYADKAKVAKRSSLYIFVLLCVDKNYINLPSRFLQTFYDLDKNGGNLEVLA